jgi:hypothetical protein
MFWSDKIEVVVQFWICDSSDCELQNLTGGQVIKVKQYENVIMKSV